MSKVAIKGADNGTGIFTIESPATNTDRTLILPDNAGTVLTSDSDLVATKLTGIVPSGRMPAGSVLQVVTNTITGPYVYSGDWHNTAVDRSITPSSSSSKILVTVSLGRVAHYDGNTLAFRFIRNGGLVCVGDAIGSRSRITASMMRVTTDANHSQGLVGFSFLDSPGSTSAQSYILQANAEGNATWYLNRQRSYADASVPYSGIGVSTIVLMEIAG